MRGTAEGSTASQMDQGGASTDRCDGLRALPPADGATAMQKINVAAVRPGLMLALFGTAAVCVAVGVGAATGGSGRRQVALLVGSALYLVGAIGVTAGYNVPRNNTLAAADPADPRTATLWGDYLRQWTAGNHVRAAASIAAAASFLWALSQDS